MPTVYSAWQGTGYKARIRLDYTITYNAARTNATFAGTFYGDFGGSISDTSNTCGTSGDCGSWTGAVAFSVPSGGGIEKIRSFSGVTLARDASVSAYLDNVEAVGGGKISGSFTLDIGVLAPYLNNSNYAATSITTSGFSTTGLSGNGNGSTLTDTQIQYNTSQSETGATTVTKGSYANMAVTGLKAATTYYFRMRVKNTTYWSAWGSWKAVTTLSTIPSAPASTWVFSGTSQTEFSISGISVPSNGGSALTEIKIRYSTDPAFATYTDVVLPGTATTATVSGLIPGTTYYVRIFAKNANGYSPATPDKSVTTLPGVSVRVNGSWKNAVPYVRSNGSWKPAVRFIRSNGSWKQ